MYILTKKKNQKISKNKSYIKIINLNISLFDFISNTNDNILNRELDLWYTSYFVLFKEKINTTDC